MAPAGTPAPIVRKLNAAMRQVLAQKEVIDAFAVQGLDVTPSSPEELANQMQAEQQKWAKVLDHAVMNNGGRVSPQRGVSFVSDPQDRQWPARTASSPNPRRTW